MLVSMTGRGFWPSRNLGIGPRGHGAANLVSKREHETSVPETQQGDITKKLLVRRGGWASDITL
jgi:hypothetical protein